MSYDSKCHDLASAFLADTPAINTEKSRDELAQTIQTAIEDWINLSNGQNGETRCKNCDHSIGPDGKTLVDHFCEDHDICPDCGGPLNERRIYGAIAVNQQKA